MLACSGEKLAKNGSTEQRRHRLENHACSYYRNKNDMSRLKLETVARGFHPVECETYGMHRPLRLNQGRIVPAATRNKAHGTKRKWKTNWNEQARHAYVIWQPARHSNDTSSGRCSSPSPALRSHECDFRRFQEIWRDALSRWNFDPHNAVPGYEQLLGHQCVSLNVSTDFLAFFKKRWFKRLHYEICFAELSINNTSWTWPDGMHVKLVYDSRRWYLCGAFSWSWSTRGQHTLQP